MKVECNNLYTLYFVTLQSNGEGEVGFATLCMHWLQHSALTYYFFKETCPISLIPTDIGYNI